MSEAIIVALVTGALAIIGNIILTHQSNQKVLLELEKRSEISDVKLEGQITQMRGVWEVKLQSLTEAVNKHNGFAERIPVLEERVKSLSTRVSELEHEIGHRE
jgi:chaperonin cofactor prefoldin